MIWGPLLADFEHVQTSGVPAMAAATPQLLGYGLLPGPAHTASRVDDLASECDSRPESTSCRELSIAEPPSFTYPKLTRSRGHPLWCLAGTHASRNSAGLVVLDG